MPYRPAGNAGGAGLRALRGLVEACSWAQPALAGGWCSVTAEPSSGSPDRPGWRGPSSGTTAVDCELDRVHALVRLAQDGDAEAFALLYERYVEVVYRYVYHRVGSHHVAEDLTSETFVRALRRLDSFIWTGRDIAAWFVTIARNIVVDHVKSSRYRLEVTTGDLGEGAGREPSPEHSVLERLRDEQLLSAVKRLRPDQQECLALRFLQGLSLAETADVMGRSAGAVKQLQLRAVRALHRELGGVRP